MSCFTLETIIIQRYKQINVNSVYDSNAPVIYVSQMLEQTVETIIRGAQVAQWVKHWPANLVV